MSTLNVLQPATPRVAFYIRVSTDEQAERSTPRNQIEFLERKYAVNFEENSLEPMQLIGTFSDEGYSGALPLTERPEAQRLLALVRARAVDMVIVYRLDRLGRSVRVLIDAYEELQKNGVAIMSATEPFDTRTSIGRFVFQLLGSIAELEREMIKDRTRQGRERNVRDGKHLSGPVPFGYALDEQGYLVPSEIKIPELGDDVTEADAVKMIFERLADGQSGRSIAEWLSALGVPSIRRYASRDGKIVEKVNGRWSETRVYSFLSLPDKRGDNLMYVGRRNRTTTNGAVIQMIPALVDRPLWDRAKQALDGQAWRHQNGDKAGPKSAARYVYLLSGKVFCDSCDLLMSGNYRDVGRQDRRSKPRLYYVCGAARGKQGSRRAGRQVCQGHTYVDGDLLEGMVLDMLDGFMAQPNQYVESLAEQAKERWKGLSQEDGLRKQARERLAEAEAGRATIGSMLVRGRITETDAERAYSESDQLIADLRKELSALESREQVARFVSDQLARTTQLFEECGPLWAQARASNDRVALRKVTQDFVREIRVASDGGVNLVFWPSQVAAELTDASRDSRYGSIYPKSGDVVSSFMSELASRFAASVARNSRIA